MTRQETAVCRHCHSPIVRTPAGGWVHTSLREPCRDPWGYDASTVAEPPPWRAIDLL